MDACPSQRLTFRRAGISTVRKINLGFGIAPTRWFDRRPLELANMPAHQQESKKNYIRIVSDKTDEQRAVDSLPRSDRLAKEYLLSLMAAVLHRDIEAR
jgi:hypothetical protein